MNPFMACQFQKGKLFQLYNDFPKRRADLLFLRKRLTEELACDAALQGLSSWARKALPSLLFMLIVLPA